MLGVRTRELHGDGDDSITAVTAVMGLDFMPDTSVFNSGDGDSSHGSTAVVVTELTVGLFFIHGLK